MYDRLFYIAVLGSEHVGKKTFAKGKFLDSFRDSDYMLTTGAEISLKTIEIDETIVKLQLRTFSCAQYRWDKNRKGNLGILVRGAHGAIVLYDVTSSKSIEQIPPWIQIVRDYAGDIPILLAGNKLDLNEQRKISKEQIETIKNEYNIASAVEISAKTGENIEKLFSTLTNLILN